MNVGILSLFFALSLAFANSNISANLTEPLNHPDFQQSSGVVSSILKSSFLADPCFSSNASFGYFYAKPKLFYPNGLTKQLCSDIAKKWLEPEKEKNNIYSKNNEEKKYLGGSIQNY